MKYWLLASIYPVDGSNGKNQENLENSRCRSCSRSLLSILKLALRGLYRAHWAGPLTSMHLRSQTLTLGLWTDLTDLSVIEIQQCSG